MRRARRPLLLSVSRAFALSPSTTRRGTRRPPTGRPTAGWLADRPTDQPTGRSQLLAAPTTFLSQLLAEPTTLLTQLLAEPSIRTQD